MEDIINKQYNELTVKEHVPDPGNGKYRSWNTNNWVRCRCSCGRYIEAPLYGVTHGLIKSCGHYRSQKAAETIKKIKEQYPAPNAVYLTHDGITKNISEWSRETGIPRTTILYRMNRQMPSGEILKRK